MKRNKSKKSGSLIGVIVLGIICLLIIIPLVYVLSISLSHDSDIVTYGYRLIPKRLTLDAYRFVFASAKTIFRAYGVTILVTVLGTFMSLFLTTTLAYVASRKDFPYRKPLGAFMVFTLLFNGGMVASYIVNTQVLHLGNTIWALTLPYGVNVWYAFLMKGFMSNLPFELVESSKIDGAGEFRIFFRIILPMSTASLATIGLFYAFAFWNDWWLAMLYITDLKLMPLQQLLQRIMSNIEFFTTKLPAGISVGDGFIPVESMRMALAVIAIGPMLLIFPFFQKYFVKGITLGSVKG